MTESETPEKTPEEKIKGMKFALESELIKLTNKRDELMNALSLVNSMINTLTVQRDLFNNMED